MYVVPLPDRTVPALDLLRSSPKGWALGKTRVWNETGEEPPGLSSRVPAGPFDPPVWVGDWARRWEVMLSFRRPSVQNSSTTQDHAFLFATISLVPDLQVAWLLRLVCAALRSN